MVNKSAIVVTFADIDRLSGLVRALKHFLFRDQLRLESLEQTLETAEVTSSERVPRDVIRMNFSIRVLDLDTRKKELYTLVFPDHADISSSRISVLAPVGLALLGRKRGDVIETNLPGGARRLRVDRVWQSPDLARRHARPGRSNRRELCFGRTIQGATLAL
jgi:regulator of nucleoside diphosphate kinase